MQPMNRLRRACARSLIILPFLFAGAAGAQDYPRTQPVKIVVPFAAGSASDAVARVMADELQKVLGGSFFVENRPGAGGLIGTEVVAKAPADGYTLLLTSNSTHALAPFMYKKVPYDSVKDFTHLGQWVSAPFVLVVKADYPSKTLAEFLETAGMNPGKVAYGYGTPSSQLGALLLESLAGVRTLGVSYKSHPAAVTDLVAGQTQFMVLDAVTALPLIRAGRLKPLGVTTSRRIPILPDVPAIAESLPGYEYATWLGLAAPAGIPRPVAERITAATRKVLASPEAQQRLSDLFVTVDPKWFPDQEAYVRSNLDVWRKRFADWKIDPQ